MNINRENKKNNLQFALMYFVGIIMVLAGHANGGGISIFFEWFPPYAFHLALFIFCSGYFFVNNDNKEAKKIIIQKTKKFIIPLYIWNMVYGILLEVLHYFGIKFGSSFTFENLLLSPIYSGHRFVFNLASWFIIPLYTIEILNIFVLKKLLKQERNYYIYFIITLLLGFGGVKIALNGFNNQWLLYMIRCLYFLPFFSLGMLYKKCLEEKIDKISNFKYFSLIIIINFAQMYIFGGVKSYTPSWCNDFDNFYRPFLVGILGIAFWVRICKILVPLLGSNNIIKYVSKHTMDIMYHHLFGFFLLNTLYMFLAKISLVKHFDFNKYSTTIWYNYLPRGVSQFRIFYIIFGIIFSLGVAKLIEIIETKLLASHKISKAKIINQRK